MSSYKLHSICVNGRARELEEALASIPEERLRENVNAFNYHGFTPLHSAVFHDNYKAVELLLRKGADATIPAHRDQWTFALHLAAIKGGVRMARLLLINGGDLFLCDWDGYLPVQIAESTGNKPTAAYLRQQMTLKKDNTFGYPEWTDLGNGCDAAWWRRVVNDHPELDYFSDGGTPAPVYAQLRRQSRPLLARSTSQPITFQESMRVNTRPLSVNSK